MRKHSQSDWITGMIAGAAGGVAGVLAMELYWKAVNAVTGEDPRSLTSEGPPHALDEPTVVGRQHEEGESSTAAVGRLAHEAVTGREPGGERKQKLSTGVHWGYGIGVGSLFGALHANGTDAFNPGGLAYGTALWALGDEMMVPLLGLAEGPTAYPVKQHVHRLTAHLVYGLALSATTSMVHGLIRNDTPSWTSIGWKAAKGYLSWKAVKGVTAAGTKAMAGAVRSRVPSMA